MKATFSSYSPESIGLRLITGKNRIALNGIDKFFKSFLFSLLHISSPIVECTVVWGTIRERRNLTVKIFVHINTSNCGQSLSLHTKRSEDTSMWFIEMKRSQKLEAGSRGGRRKMTINVASAAIQTTRNYFIYRARWKIRWNRSREILTRSCPRKARWERTQRRRNAQNEKLFIHDWYVASCALNINATAHRSSTHIYVFLRPRGEFLRFWSSFFFAIISRFPSSIVNLFLPSMRCDFRIAIRSTHDRRVNWDGQFEVETEKVKQENLKEDWKLTR